MAWGVRNLTIPALKLCVTLLLSTLIFVIGYAWLDFGPLTWAEFVFFPILCHFLFVGRRVKKMFADTEAALRSSQTETPAATPSIPPVTPKVAPNNAPTPVATTPYLLRRETTSTPPT
jgi:hypothetical protein